MNQLSIPRGDRATVKKVGGVAKVDQFLPLSKSRHPKTVCRVAHDGRNVFLRFDVRDRWVHCLKRPFQGHVYHDSCVEFFVRPTQKAGYFNFEFNCCGQMLIYYIEDWRRDENRQFLKRTPLTRGDAKRLKVATNLKAPIDPEITKPTNWWLEATIPVALLEKYVGRLGDLSGQTWRANFQKCGDENSRPHWATWNNIGPVANFHQPSKFGKLVFE